MNYRKKLINICSFAGLGAIIMPCYNTMWAQGSKMSSCVESVGDHLTTVFNVPKNLPQYRYIARPIYKAAGGRDNPLFSVPVTFAATDIIMHKLLQESLVLLFIKDNWQTFKLNPTLYLKNELLKNRVHRYTFVFWTALSIPVAWYKHIENKNRSKLK